MPGVDHDPLSGARSRQHSGRSSDLPPAVGFALWADAWMSGTVSLDDASEEMSSGDDVHLVAGLPGQEAGAEPLILGLGRMRTLGARRARLALPSPGDPVGLAGPPSFNEAALEHGSAVLLPGTSWGLVPVVVGASITWSALSARTDAPPLDPGESDRGLRASLTSTAGALADLDVARWSPDAADEIMALRRVPETAWPPQVGPQAARVLVLATRCLRICELALADAGGARTAQEANRRRETLESLAGAARRAVVAASAVHQW